MSDIRLVLGLARREAFERLRSRAFQISTAIVLLAAVAAVVLPAVLLDEGPTNYAVGVVGAAHPGFEQALQYAAPEDVVVEVIEFADLDTGTDALSEDLDVLLADEQLIWDGQPDVELEFLVRSGVNQNRLQDRANDVGLGSDELAALLAPVELESTNLAQVEGGMQERGPQVLIATVGMVLLFVSITYYGSQILMSVIEEKQNRVVEVLLAHVEPRHLLAGKVIGHGLLGLAQITAIALIGVVGLIVLDPIEVPTDAYGAIANAVMWFILGYAFYAILYGSLGSLASRTEDAQSAIGPLTIVLMAAYFLTFTVVDNPSSPLAVIGSFLPPTAPLMMPLRTALTDVPVWQPIVAVVIELASIYGFVRLGGRLYGGAVMQTGKKLSISEAWRATGSTPSRK